MTIFTDQDSILPLSPFPGSTTDIQTIIYFRAREAKVNYYNAGRQKTVNAAAEYKGAGTGTAAKYGVPGIFHILVDH